MALATSGRCEVLATGSGPAYGEGMLHPDRGSSRAAARALAPLLGRLLLGGLLLVTTGAGLAACGDTDRGAGSARTSPSSAPDPAAQSSPSKAPRPAPTRTLRGSVLLVSVDGLNPDAVTRLGSKGAPHITRLLATGTGTRNARTAVELTRTLPNHTGMVTGRRIAAAKGGHGVTWNDARTRPATVRRAAGEPVSSIFSVVHEAGGSSALFAAKSKFSLWKRSWPRAIDRSVVTSSDTQVVAAVRKDLRSRDRALRFVHLAAPDKVGHAHRFMSAEYLAAVRRTDARLGKVLRTLARTRPSTTVVLTSDHGGEGAGHGERNPASSRVILVAAGPGIARGANLYALDPELHSPGSRRPGYGTARPPARNLAAGNLALQTIGLGPVPGSEPEAAGPFRLTR